MRSLKYIVSRLFNASARYWARKLTELGHAVKLMTPQFVKPYVKTNKSCTGHARGS
jgi:transposase